MRWQRDRSYRATMGRPGLVQFGCRLKETDLHCQAPRDLTREVERWVLELRMAIEDYVASHPGFIESKVPLPMDETAPPVVREMLNAGISAGVGPMAAVAGAIAQAVGRRIVTEAGGEAIVENGGDIYLCCKGDAVVTVYAGSSPLSGRIGIKIYSGQMPLGVCTSSGTVGHSRSMGRADSVTVLASDAAVADAWATALGNVVKGPENISAVLKIMEEAPEIAGGLVIVGKRMGAWGELELVVPGRGSLH